MSLSAWARRMVHKHEKRDELIAGLMNPNISPVIDFEKSYKDLHVFGCDHMHASQLADRIIREDRVNRSLQIMNDTVLRDGQRAINVEFRERELAQLEKSQAEQRALRAPLPMSEANRFAMRGGNPGGWFDTSETAYDGGVSYRQSGRPVNDDMERRVRSAFATH